MDHSLFVQRFRNGLPDELKQMQDDVEAVARAAGLDFFPVVFEMVKPEEMSMLAAFGGFPTRYPHWRFGMEFEQIHKSYSYGLSKIYEMVINTDPCTAYLMNVNHNTDQKLVMAHVYGHCDFFKNNMWFGHTNRKMLDAMANHATKVRKWVDRLGLPRVEEFIDTCLSVDNLIDIHSAAIRRQPAMTETGEHLRARVEAGETPDLPQAQDFKYSVDRSYMDEYINPKAEVLAAREKALEETLKPQKVPAKPERDVLGFILQHARLHDWEREILGIIREESLYFAPQAQTKIMNEGWATFWHTKLMTEKLARADEIVQYAHSTSGTTAMGRKQLNPYKLGLELFRDIERRWDTGRHGREYDECDDMTKKREWFRDERGGIQKIYEVRRIYNDVQFVDAFLTEEFCRRQGFFAYAYDKKNKQYVIESREFDKIKQQLLKQLTNFGQPIVEVVDANHDNRGELLMEHRHGGDDLQMDWAETALGNLTKLWRRPVHIHTQLNGRPVRLSHDGENASRTFLDRKGSKKPPKKKEKESS